MREIIKQQILWIHRVFDDHVQKPYEFIWFLTIRKPYEFIWFLVMIRKPVNLYEFWSPEKHMILYGLVLLKFLHLPEHHAQKPYALLGAIAASAKHTSFDKCFGRGKHLSNTEPYKIICFSGDQNSYKFTGFLIMTKNHIHS